MTWLVSELGEEDVTYPEADFISIPGTVDAEMNEVSSLSPRMRRGWGWEWSQT